MRKRKLFEFDRRPNPLSARPRNRLAPSGTSADSPPTGWRPSAAGLIARFGAARHGAGLLVAPLRTARDTRAAPAADGSPGLVGVPGHVLQMPRPWSRARSRSRSRNAP